MRNIHAIINFHNALALILNNFLGENCHNRQHGGPSGIVKNLVGTSETF